VSEAQFLHYSDRLLEVPLAALNQYVTQQGNPGNAKGIREAEVQLPAEFLRRGFHFVDTPGLGSAFEENTRTTESYLPEADAFLLVTSFDSPLSEEEMRFLREVRSSSRRVFVVLNKQDTINDEERGEALEYVRRKLDATFEQNAPKIFSVSARQALEAKQAHDSRRLEASGILVLEQELVDFLLSQKRLEFLLRMCDRLADLARGFPASEQTRGLAERIAALSRRIAVDSPGPARGEPAQASATDGPTAAQVRPCEVCAAASSALWEFQRRFQYEIMINPAAQRDLAAHGGLCSFHTWQYEASSSPQGISEGYPAVLEDWAAWMRGAASDENMLGVAAKLDARLPNETSCVLCRVRATAESEAIAGLSRRLTVDGSQALNHLSALCVPHFARLVGTLRNQQLVGELLTRQAALLDRLAEDMKRSALKRDGVRRYLLSDEEESASKRGLALLARARPIAD
jgi:GTP-binding protein EngB required for normal cell division